MAVPDTIALTLVLAVLVGCAPAGPVRPTSASAKGPGAEGEAAYGRPPAVTAAAISWAGRVRLEGAADPGSRVRLATPAGQALFADVGADGNWRLSIPETTGVRLFGLSMAKDHRIVQSESYLAIMPTALAVQLRSGAGAVVLGSGAPRLAVTALDVDRKGGAVLSGRAAPGAMVDLLVDGAPRGRAVADAAGRYTMDLDEPLQPGDHELKAASGPAQVMVDASLLALPQLAQGPFAADRAAGAWRIVWVTPAGGVQTTLVFERGGNA
ncbi:MAG TPA: hypothetical protein VGG92_11125 [Caulobacteraceae bacterium]